MKKNDKIIVSLGVVILIIASVGIYFWTYEEAKAGVPSATELAQVCGVFSSEVDAVTVSDSNPFYPLITTPLAVHYDPNGEQYVAPLYVMNLDKPSSAVSRVIEMIGAPSNALIVESGSSEEVSLKVAQEYWESSKAVILIEDNQAGYNLGVLATPLASYLSAPVIVTNETDSDVMQVLQDLGVEYSLVCGNVEGYGSTYKFDSADDVVNLSIDIVEKKFGEVNYITLTNPVDAWPPRVLDSVKYDFGPVTVTSLSYSQMVNFFKGLLTGSSRAVWTFKIPDDYKYALVKFEGINLDIDEVDVFGDAASFKCGVNLEDAPQGLKDWEVAAGGTGWGGIAERDASGKIISDKVYLETVLYDRGGAEYTIGATGGWVVKKQGRVSAHVVVEKLENPVYPMMKGLSSMAPYLTAYHNGIVFGKPEFAFTANDDVITDKGETCPGLYVPSKNPKLTPMSNMHVYDKIHVPLNNLLAKIAGITLEKDKDIKSLQEYYASSPIYITLVGDATVLPNYYYQNIVEPFDIDGDEVDNTPYFWGGGTPSDVFYGNIDPKLYDWSNLADDIYTEYPFVENIVGRITGWDTQDVSALIARTVFYNKIIRNMEVWKNNIGILVGDGQDFQKPLIRYLILGDILKVIPYGEPMKYWTGYAEITALRTQNLVAKPLGFNVQYAFGEEAARQGLTDDAIARIKKANLLNRLFFSKMQVKNLFGEGKVRGAEIMESSNYLFVNGHGCEYSFTMPENNLAAAGLGGPLMHTLLIETYVPIKGGTSCFPGGSLGQIGEYSTRTVADMNLGPSFMWLESCICGKIDGYYPKNTLGQAFLHAGVNALIISPTGTNIGGGYLEPKKSKYDLPGQALIRYIKAKINANKGIYPDPHFGYKVYNDLCEELRTDDCSVGLALRDARNKYLLADADWLLWWSPPLVNTGDSALNSQLNAEMLSRAASGLSPMMESKYVTFQEYFLFGDPAFNPYEPVNEGGK